LSKVFEIDASRVDEFDFHNSDVSKDVEIDVVVGNLGAALEQRFLDQLEFWDPSGPTLIDGVDDPAALPGNAATVLRLAYRARWEGEEERSNQTVYWPKTSDPTIDDLRRITRDDRRTFPFLRLVAGRPLNLGSRGLLRSSLATGDAEAIADALKEMAEGIEGLTAQLTALDAVRQALEPVLTTLRSYAGVDTPVDEMLAFLPEDGSLSSLLRSLAPALDLGDAVGPLPLARHGSTTIAQVITAEVISAAGKSDAVVAIDDFGDGLDAASAQRLASLLRRKAGQVWLSTRRPEAARGFEQEELVRLTRTQSTGVLGRAVHYGRVPASRAERVATRELHRQILPAMTARALLVGEGPHDSSAYAALAERLDMERGVLPPEAYGIRIMDAGSTDGGIDKIVHVAQLARSLGFRVVALTDYDRDEVTAASRLAALQAAADAVVRPRKGVAIEAALLEGVPDGDIVAALQELSQRYTMPLPAGWETLTGPDLSAPAIKALKSNNGLHASFLRALSGTLPPLACGILSAAIECARGVRTEAYVQL
jgi:hypothetical protein